MTPSYKATDQKWTIWDCPDDPFTHNKYFFRFAIELPVFDHEDSAEEIMIRPSYTITKDEKSLFTCGYEMEYEITFNGEKLTPVLLTDIILSDCYPAFVKAFNEQKEEFPAVKELPPPELTQEVRNTVLEGSVKALKDSGHTQ